MPRPPGHAGQRNPRRWPINAPRCRRRGWVMGGGQGATETAPTGYPYGAGRVAAAGERGRFFRPRQPCSITLATLLWHSAHLPTSNKFPPLTTPEKFVIVTSCRQAPHQTLESSSFRMSGGMTFHCLAAGAVKSGMVSTVMCMLKIGRMNSVACLPHCQTRTIFRQR